MATGGDALGTSGEYREGKAAIPAQGGKWVRAIPAGPNVGIWQRCPTRPAGQSRPGGGGR